MVSTGSLIASFSYWTASELRETLPHTQCGRRIRLVLDCSSNGVSCGFDGRFQPARRNEVMDLSSKIYVRQAQGQGSVRDPADDGMANVEKSQPIDKI